VRKKLAYVQDQAAKWARQAEQLQTVSKERDHLRQQVTVSVNERNTLQSQLQQFSRELQSLAGKVESALGSSSAGPPLTSATPVPLPGSL
jgi:hypothetical protein